MALDQATPQGLSGSDYNVEIAMETRSPLGDRPAKSPGASHMDLDPGSYPQSSAVFFCPEPVLGPADPAGSAPPTVPLTRGATWVCASLGQRGSPAQPTILHPETR